ncbi:MAG TPA: MgtC/SapB family protein [Gammaproteobacteria bacterium]|jgi:putative Mg2+ transporter-C (MgtC) family protein|nr:MgtC/SapB family protein [Gammaproteobacteria bacterium]
MNATNQLDFFNNWAGQLTLLVQIVIAMLLGAVLGLERELANKPAGFRTLVLIAGACALLVGLARVMTADFGNIFPPSLARADPVRVIQSIVTAVGFLGAGTIFRRKSDDMVEGLTTAATVLLAAAIGIACALNQFIVAGGITLIALVVLRVMSRVELRRRA